MKYVRGYYRQRKDKTETDLIPAAMLIGGTIVVMAVVFWQVTLTAGIIVAAGYALRWHFSNRIVINDYSRSRWQRAIMAMV